MRKAGSPPSRFWMRLEEAFKEQGLPTTQTGIAKILGMSQGSTGPWFHGDTEPREIDTYRRLAIKGKVCVDWLITGRKPKYPISSDPTLCRIMEICCDLDQAGKDAVLRAVRREKVQKDQGGR